MNILLLTIKVDEGLNLAKQLADYKYNVKVSGIASINRSPLIKFLLILKMIYCENKKYDLIITEDVIFGGIAGLILSKINNIPYILYLKGFFPLDCLDSPYPILGNTLGNFINILVMKKSDHIVYVSNWLKKNYDKYLYQKNINLQGQSFSIIHHAPDPYFLKKEINITNNSEEFKISYVGNLNFKGKAIGVLLLLKSVKQLLKIYEDSKLKLYIIGGGKYLNILKRKAFTLNIEKYVIFTGKIDKVTLKKHYCSSDVFVYPSFQDACPTVVMEAQALGVPVIVTKSSGAVELVEDKITGYLCYPTIDSLTQIMMILIKNVNIRHLLGSNASKYIYKNLTWRNTANKFNKIIKYKLFDNS